MPQLLTPGLILRESAPSNLESPFSALDGQTTPQESFYVRNHFPVPAIDPGNWRLRIEGAVARPLILSYAELEQMPKTTVPALLECAGNNRAFLSPEQEGVQWALGAVGCAEWTGVSLATVLERAGIGLNAVEVILEGCDQGVPAKDIRPEQPISYTRSIPLAKALQPEVLLAYSMNGEPLQPAHGAPVRAIVPGWYAMASVKWLTRILISPRAFHGYFQTIDYAYWSEVEGEPAERVPIGPLAVKAQIARPALSEVIPGGSHYRVHGAAWSAGTEIARVEITTDGGTTWEDAKLSEGQGPYAWRLWDYVWQVPKTSGSCTLMARASDAQDSVQPATHNRNYEGYVIHHLLPIQVQIS